MLQTLSKSRIVPMQIRGISYKSIRSWYAGLFKAKKTKPPFQHIIQIGDPTLRTVSEKVPEDFIQSPEIKFVIKRLKYVFDKFDCVGLSATQIGVPFQIIIFEFNKKHAKAFSDKQFKNMEMYFHPQQVIINPELKVMDYTKIIFPESCESVRGFHADVPRYQAVEVKGLDEDGKPVFLQTQGWLSRIIQHEMDHLNGKVYTDIMDRKTLTCSCWEVVNDRQGKVELPFGAH